MATSNQVSESSWSFKAQSDRVRAGARNNKLNDQKANDGPSDLQKPAMSSHSSSNTMRPKNASSRPLKTNPTLSASHSISITENSVSPTSSQNRRKRSEARRGTKTIYPSNRTAHNAPVDPTTVLIQLRSKTLLNTSCPGIHVPPSPHLI